MFRNLLMKIKYDGSEFCGWQRQPAVPTVQGEIERVLAVLCAQEIKINGTSRTDTGVHGIEQCATFEGEFAIPTENIKRAVNNMIDPAIYITEVVEMPEGFHARFDCESKTYVYKIQNTIDKDPFKRNYCYSVDRKLNIEDMKRAVTYMRGTHDFKCFQASGGEERETTVRTIKDIKVTFSKIERESCESDPRDFQPMEITVEVTGDGFLYNMVRIMIGTIVEVGLGRIKAEDVKDIIESKDRQRAGHTAPPQGLYLKKIYFR